MLLAVAALGLVACSSGDEDEATTEVGLSREQRIEQEIEQTGNRLARLFAGGERFCELMTQPACRRTSCETVSGPIWNCTPPSTKLRKSFEDATVEDVAITGGQAAARFSNGENVDLKKVHNIPDPFAEDGDRSGWLIHTFGEDAGDVAFITDVGNAWAPLFAEDNSAACEFMFGQPLCTEFFGRIGEPPDVGRPSAFQESFANATVERVEVEDARQIRTQGGTLIELHRAGAEFSNGEVVEFIQETDTHRPLFGQLGAWFIQDVGGNAGRGFFK
jgi:hypothetical protein